jgi:hypothetical protein
MHTVGMSIAHKIIVSLLIALFLSIPVFCRAENRFSIVEGSKNYSADITVEKCEKGLCEGKETIKL